MATSFPTKTVWTKFLMQLLNLFPKKEEQSQMKSCEKRYISKLSTIFALLTLSEVKDHYQKFLGVLMKKCEELDTKIVKQGYNDFYKQVLLYIKTEKVPEPYTGPTTRKMTKGKHDCKGYCKYDFDVPLSEFLSYLDRIDSYETFGPFVKLHYKLDYVLRHFQFCQDTDPLGLKVNEIVRKISNEVCLLANKERQNIPCPTCGQVKLSSLTQPLVDR